MHIWHESVANTEFIGVPVYFLLHGTIVLNAQVQVNFLDRATNVGRKIKNVTDCIKYFF